VELTDYWLVRFYYDGLGRLVGREDYAASGEDWNIQAVTIYIYDGMRVIQERAYPDTPTVSYTRGTDLSGTLEGAGGIGGLLARSHGYASTNGNWYAHNFYHADGNGNITYLVNSSQGLAASYRYDAYGNWTDMSGPLAGANTYRFSSKMIDDVTGMYNYGYRWYAPYWMRWLNRDPKWDEGFAELSKVSRRGNTSVIDRSRRLATQRNFEDLYVFVFNNPLNRKDPLGLDSPGCDFFGWTDPCRLECCAEHDECYDEPNNCSWCSWFNPLPFLTACGRCNLAAFGCVLDCLNGYGDNPDRPNYYCAVHNVPFDDPNSEHMNHRTN